MNDNTTFFLAFLTVFLGLAWYLYRLHQCNKTLAARLDAVTANLKTNDDGPES